MDFGALPPEVNSGLMYSGPGSGSMLAAAAAWDGLAAELNSTAVSYSSEVSGLADRWLGPSSVAMTAAVAPYIGWMTATAGQSEQAATQARAAAAAYEAAHAMTVPPPVIAANRSLLMTLIATNFLGQNFPAIAATEAHYAEMWAQDAAAMYGYAGSSAAASQLSPFSTPPQTANPLAAVAPAASVAAGSAETQAALSQLTAAVPSALQSLAAPLAASPGSELGTSSLLGLTSLMMPLRMATMPLMMLSRLAMMGGMMGGARTMSATGGLGSAVGGTSGLPAGVLTSAGMAGTGPAGLGTLVASGTPVASPVAASLGKALPVGALSVPQGWGAASPGVTLTSATTPISGPHAGHAASAANSGMVPPVLPMSPTAGRGVGDNAAPRLDPRPTVMARSPLGG